MPVILGIGMDLCKIERIQTAIAKPRFLERIYTAREQARILEAGEHRRGEIASGLFAAKEAVAKALGTGISGFGFADIEIMPDGLGKPVCTLSGKALERFLLLRGKSIFVTITHESGMAAATAVIEGGEHT